MKIIIYGLLIFSIFTGCNKSRQPTYSNVNIPVNDTKNVNQTAALDKEAKEEYKKRIREYFTQCSDRCCTYCEYVKFTTPKPESPVYSYLEDERIYRIREIYPQIESRVELSEADKNNGIEWKATITPFSLDYQKYSINRKTLNQESEWSIKAQSENYLNVFKVKAEKKNSKWYFESFEDRLKVLNPNLNTKFEKVDCVKESRYFIKCPPDEDEEEEEN